MDRDAQESWSLGGEESSYEVAQYGTNTPKIVTSARLQFKREMRITGLQTMSEYPQILNPCPLCFLVSAVVVRFALLPTQQFYIGVSLAINNATGPDRRGELNGIVMTTSSVARSLSPVLASALFAFSIDGNHPFPFDYHLAFYCIALVRLTVAWLGWNRICDNGAVGGNRLMFGE